MATALKDIQFASPMLVGEANENNGTTYTLGSHDELGPIANASFTPPGESSSQAMWGFAGVANYARLASLAAGISYGGSGLEISGEQIHSMYEWYLSQTQQ